MSQERPSFGEMTEASVQRFVEDAFSSDFVFRSPKHKKGRQEKETTDVLVLYDDLALAIEVKSHEPVANAAATNLGWATKSLRKAVEQVKGAAKTVRQKKIIRLVNKRRGSVDFAREDFKYVYGVIVLNHKSEPYLPAELVSEIAKVDFPIHVLSFADFYNVARVLDTPGDLTNYFEIRSDVLIPTFKPKVHEEQELFEYYLENLEELTAFRARAYGDNFDPSAAKPYADALRQIYAGNHPNAEAGKFIDKIIDWAHQVDPNLETPFDELKPDAAQYIVVATQLGHMVRPRRIDLGKKFLEAIERAGRTGKDTCVHGSSGKRDDCFLFLASVRPEAERKQRNEDLLSSLALLKTFRQVRRGIGIATEAGFGGRRSYDLIFIDSDPSVFRNSPDWAETEKLGRAAFGELANTQGA